MDKVLNTLGLCKRAGKLIMGFDAVLADINKAAGVLVTSDISVKTKKETQYHCDRHKRRLIEIDSTMDEVKKVLGKQVGVMSITDMGLYKKLTESNPNRETVD